MTGWQSASAGAAAAAGAPPAVASILLVDDRPENLLSLEALLEPLGHGLGRASSAEEALRRVLAGDFALILLDVMMPGTDGYEAARLIRQREKSRSTPIIFLTALGEDRRHATLGYESGAVDYMFKPLDPDLLRAKVAAFVELYQNREQLAWLQRRRYADLAIQESEERFRLVQKATNDVIWDWDLVGDTIRWNEMAHHVFRVLPGEIPEDVRWWHEHVHPADRDRVLTGIHAVIQGEGDGHSWSDEYRFRLGDGSYISILDRGYVARNGAGEPVRMIGAMQDVTQRTRARAEAEAAREAAERARADAEAASRAKGDFLATITHELRTPINAIVGYTELLELGLAGPVTDAQRTHLGRVRASSEHLLALVNDVLDISKVEAGELTVVREECPVAPVVNAALVLVRPQATAKHITLLEEGEDPGSIRYVGDEYRVRQILLNLLSNAVKFTESGGRVAVRCQTVDRPAANTRLAGAGPWTSVVVEDTGIGIPSDQIARIFDPFVQAEAGHTRTRGGTGLGLTISRRLARLMGGDLTVESRPGAGSTFALWLPSARVGEAGAESAEARGARADRRTPVTAVRGLGEVGETLRETLEPLVGAYLERMRADPLTPLARRMRRPELEDHAVSLVGDLAQSLIIIDEAGERAAELLRDGSAIQRTIAEHHGARRQAQGWSEEALRRDCQILGEEIARLLQAPSPGAAPASGGADRDVAYALQVLRGLMERVEVISVGAWQHAVRRGGR